MEKTYFGSDENRGGDPIIAARALQGRCKGDARATQGQTEGNLRRGQEEGKKRVRRGKEEGKHRESIGKAKGKQRESIGKRWDSVGISLGRRWVSVGIVAALLLLILLPAGVWGQTPTPITSLSDIGSTGDYIITGDIDASGFSTSITSFSGTLEADINPATKMPYRIKNLTKPLFTTLDGGTVKNLVIENVDISQSGKVGAIACTANGAARIYNVGILAGSVESTGTSTSNNSNDCCGGLVGFLDGEARVVNCYSYANITGGNRVGGIVGYNSVSTKWDDLKTMVFGCMFYGDITGGTNKAPIYNGKIITNRGDSNGVSNYNYFCSDVSYVQGDVININTYNCALAAEERFLNRFEFFRHLLNGHRELAGWWATGTYSSSEMHKWVLIPDSIGSDHPYPVLKIWGKYPSVVNYDAANASTGKPRNQGGKLGELTVHIQMGTGGAVYAPPANAQISMTNANHDTTLIITDKDTTHFNFNYYKVQLPYYNDVGTLNYTENRVVTGWKIVSITVNGTATTEGTGSYSTGEDVSFNSSGEITATPYNFADRSSTKKDLYGVSKRVFNQGAYWDVPDGVTAITIEPYWAKAAYLADAYPDVVYNKAMTSSYNVSNVGGGQKYTDNTEYNIAGSNQVVRTTIANAFSTLFNDVTEDTSNGHTVYDYAIVLVGNTHNIGISSDKVKRPYTIMSIDLDHDNEPDYSYILRFNSRNKVHPVRVDFINIPGLGMAQKSYQGTGTYNFGIMQPNGWFESTNTSLFRETQFEYDNSGRGAAPYILQGGVMEQWVLGQSAGHSDKTIYFHVGGNVWFKEFHRGSHQDNTYNTKHTPISVTGGDYDQFYLTGLYTADVTNYNDNAECYISGGRFGTVAGAGMEGIGKNSNNTGNITWLIDNADINEFYAGGINAANPVEGKLRTIISNSHVNFFCGGPKFGDMNDGRTVVTTATDCTFGFFFGAGYGGNSYSRYPPYNYNNKINIDWNKWINGEIQSTGTGHPWDDNYHGFQHEFSSTYDGVDTQIDYQFIPMSGNADNCARLWIEYVQFSLATTRSVTSTLTGCTIDSSFYGGGSLGKVTGDVVSVLDGCTVKGNVFGAGYSATVPKIPVMNTGGFIRPPYYDQNLGAFLPPPIFPLTVDYTWERAETVNSTETAIDEDDRILYTTEDLSPTSLGAVNGIVTLTLKGGTTVGTLENGVLKPGTGNVYGGGESSAANNNVNVTIEGSTEVFNNVYGGGDRGAVGLNTTVTLSGSAHVHGNVYGGGNEGEVGGSSKVEIKDTVTQDTDDAEEQQEH